MIATCLRLHAREQMQCIAKERSDSLWRHDERRHHLAAFSNSCGMLTVDQVYKMMRKRTLLDDE